jgi:hypothetical protein
VFTSIDAALGNRLPLTPFLLTTLPLLLLLLLLLLSPPG